MHSSYAIKIADWQEDHNALCALRTEVFIQEQGINEADEWDTLDNDAIHIVAECEEKIIACLRLLKHGKITRMAVKKSFRNRGVGRALIEATEREALALGLIQLKADAQIEALKFYQKLGFEIVSDVFIDAGIPHQSILKNLNTEKLDYGIKRFDIVETAQVALIEAVNSGSRRVDILTEELKPELYDNAEFEKALSLIARRDRKSVVRILIKNTQNIHGHTHRIINLAKRLPSKILIKKLLTEEISDPRMGYCCVDSSHLVYFNDETLFIGFNNPTAKAESQSLLDEFEHLWTHYSSEDSRLRQFIL